MRAILLAAGLAWQAISPEAVQHARAGLAAKEQGRLGDAIVEFKKVTELAPDLPAAFVNLGAAYMETKQYGEAISPLKRAVELNPDLLGAQQMLGYALLSEGNAAEAIPHFEKAQVLDGLGIAQLELGQLPQAIANLNAALTKHPNDPDLLYYLGRASGLLSKEALDTLQANYPNSARAHQALGENYAVLRRVPEAEKEYTEALRLNPYARGIHLELGQLYAAAQEWPKAAEQFEAEAKLQPQDPEAAYRLGSALLEEGKIAEARAELTRADRLRPDMPETLYALGKADSLSGDLSGAAQAWNKVVSLEKESSLAAQAHFGLAGIYRKQGKADEAQREMQEFQKFQKSR